MVDTWTTLDASDSPTDQGVYVDDGQNVRCNESNEQNTAATAHGAIPKIAASGKGEGEVCQMLHALRVSETKASQKLQTTASQDSISNRQLQSDVLKVSQILDVVMHKYQMPDYIKNFIQELQKQIVINTSLSGDSKEDLLRTLESFQNMWRWHCPPLDRFFCGPGWSKPCATWWMYFMTGVRSIEEQLKSGVRSAAGMYCMADLDKNKPTDDPQSVDENFQYDKKYKTMVSGFYIYKKKKNGCIGNYCLWIYTTFYDTCIKSRMEIVVLLEIV